MQFFKVDGYKTYENESHRIKYPFHPNPACSPRLGHDYGIAPLQCRSRKLGVSTEAAECPPP